MSNDRTNVVNKFLSCSHVESRSIQLAPNNVDSKLVDLLSQTAPSGTYSLVATLTEENQDDIVAFLIQHANRYRKDRP